MTIRAELVQLLRAALRRALGLPALAPRVGCGACGHEVASHRWGWAAGAQVLQCCECDCLAAGFR